MRTGLALLGIGLGFVVIAHARPFGNISESEDQEKSYTKFFNLEELIKKLDKFQKYGYMGLHKKISRTNVPVDKIKFKIPNLVKMTPIEDVSEYEAFVNNSAATGIEQSSPEDEETITEAISAASENISIASNTVPVGTIEDVSEAEAAENISAAMGTKQSFPEDEETITETKSAATKDISIESENMTVVEIKFKIPTLVTNEPIEDVPEAEAIEINSPAMRTKQSTPEYNETTTEAISAPSTDISIESTSILSNIIKPHDYYVAPEMAEKLVIERVMKLVEDAETAVDIIEDLESGAEVSLQNCAVPVGVVENMLLTFTKSVDSALPVIQEILDVGSTLASANTEGRTRIGTELLALLESVLEVIVPFQIPGCSADDSTSLLVSMSTMTSQSEMGQAISTMGNLFP